MISLKNTPSRAWNGARSASSRTWHWYRGRRGWQQWAIAALLFVLVVGGIAWAHQSSTPEAAAQPRTVTLAMVGSLSGDGSGTSVIGTVESVSEAELLAQTGGTVERVNTRLGARIPAGFVVAELDNASQAAAVLQAEGAYDAAVASRNITATQSQSTQVSLVEAQKAARDAYRSAFTELDTTLESQVDLFFGAPTPTGPQLLIKPGTTSNLQRERADLDDRMDAWRRQLETVKSVDPETLLRQATADAQAISDFLVELSVAANARSSEATAAQLSALAQARASVDTELAALSTARTAYDAKQTAASVAGSPRSVSGTQLAAANASVKSALGALRAAQAAYEKTRIRATIGGTVNFLPIKAGQYVNAFEHVATVANNGALEIVAYVSEGQRDAIATGMDVSVEGGHTGVVTSIAPALDPTTKQIEVHVAVDEAPDLLNGQAVRIELPSGASGDARQAVATSTPAGPILLPLAAVKLSADERIVFTVDENGELVANPVEIGQVVGDRIQITSPLPLDLRIVTDARGLSEGQRVNVATDS